MITIEPIPISQWPGMRVLTVREPWATLIVTGQKDVENRSRYFGHRGPLLIHASGTLTLSYYDNAYVWVCTHVSTPIRMGAMFPMFEKCKHNCGHIIGGCELYDCKKDNSSLWYDGFGWGLNMTGAWKAAEPVPFKGQLSLGTFKEMALL